ncbi:uncharacterized protein LOC110626937 isoform X2 [Manihot esculenta]|uniref:Uncharacterized protein n=7 Tax=Manihot esculenta TaxID=3983 RepID=A0ACB7GZG5_MANES|nr:uncharacterized protein LOC110626937 isoform X2 [Manihot esculenta]XP_043818067.1 uncharacterized protein LOC110626937 isoform X2 [Manihot esculenta]XP_043818068.1 uncharacterized protein LOC110626937 isoform X2 [Manihot esculenta]KAG8644077.1 hypothetical protein MANES_11G096900v8 [Manihot esculenta]KAG8644078.1 hypothetical protein MANES_11G096900v8 [Manihot esculenta]KAG8644079.1 hypothetical protein MANES_11G096900v8 [Manihot esculenta]KAG8644080.1 hypothetical protein MANES_11G096900v
MADYGRVHPDCVNASNPYHECAVACLEKIAQGQGRKEKKKSGSFIFEASRSFGRKKKGSESLPRSARDNISAVKTVYSTDSLSPRSPLSTKKKVESENSQSSSSSGQHSEEAFPQDHSFDKGQVQSTEFVHPSGNLMPNGTKSLSLGSFTCFAIVPPTNPEDDQKSLASSEKASSPISKNLEVTNAPTSKSLNSTFTNISRASEESDDEIQSVISDSCVSVGKYHVRSTAASILQLILDKYGDIAANCRLESTSLRAYYLECLCSVVQELQSTSLNQLSKSKVKEFLAVLKDIESVQIDVSWLRSILNELTEAMELNKQQQAAEEAKSSCIHTIESTKKELESMMEDLAKKEKEVAAAKALVEETKARLRELKLESCRLSDTILSTRSKMEKFHIKPFADEIL